MEPIIDHIQLTVKDLDQAAPFYDALMPLLGFDIDQRKRGSVAAHDFEVIEYVHPRLIFGINSPRELFKDNSIHRRKPGSLHHLAFKADSCAAVDALYPKIRDIGAHIVNPPAFYPQHGAHYYALFFKDPQGIKYEIVYEDRK